MGIEDISLAERFCGDSLKIIGAVGRQENQGKA
jgi:hypothetical protein